MIPAAAMNWNRIWINRDGQPLNIFQLAPDRIAADLNELIQIFESDAASATVFSTHYI